MGDDNYYEQSRKVFNSIAIEKQGYYDMLPGKPLRHSVWQLRVRKLALNILQPIFQNTPEILTAIDVACGKGDFTIQLSEHFPQLVKIWGCDFSEESLVIGRKDAASLDRISFQQADLLDMPFANQHFDLTLCINVLHIILPDDQVRALSELARITNRYLLLEIKNRKNFYYGHINHKTYDNMEIFPTSVQQASQLLGRHGFQLKKKKSIFLFNWLSPIIVLLFENQARDKHV